jgi:hypothetical protein
MPRRGSIARSWLLAARSPTRAQLIAKRDRLLELARDLA